MSDQIEGELGSEMRQAFGALVAASPGPPPMEELEVRAGRGALDTPPLVSGTSFASVSGVRREPGAARRRRMTLTAAVIVFIVGDSWSSARRVPPINRS